MRKSGKGKRLLSVALSVLLTVSSLPTAVFAGGHSIQEFCEHHQEHTADCGYVEGQPCSHKVNDGEAGREGSLGSSHTVDCYTDELVCGLIEDEDVIVATGSDWEDRDDEGHRHSEECYGLDCAHERGEHDEDDGACGYMEAQPCTYFCETCKKPDKKPEAGTEQTACTLTEDCTLADGHEGDCVTEDIPQLPLDGILVKTIASWTFVDDDGLTEGELALPGVDAGNQIDFDKVVSMLPTQIQAELDGEADPAMVDITGWDCPEYIQDARGNWPVIGTFTFTAELESGYTCKPLPTVTVSLGGGQTLELIEGEGYSFNMATGELIITSNVGTTAWREDTRIGAEIDYGKPNLTVTSVIVQNTVTQINDSAFRFCEKLKTAKLPDTITSIGDYAFGYSSLGGELDLSSMDKLASIGSYAFSKCPITSVVLPDSLSAFGAHAFSGCSVLTSIHMPQNNTLTSLGNFIFYQCTSLDFVDLTGCEGLTFIPMFSFLGCTALREVVFPPTLTIIDINAFGGCTSLAKLTFLGDAAPKVDKSAFEGVPQTGTLIYPEGMDYTAVKNALPQGWSQPKDQPQTIEKSTYSTNVPLVGETIVSTDGAYTPNGGGAAVVHLYQWKRADNADRTGNVIDISENKDYTTIPEDFGKYIWLETTPVGDGSMEGAPVQADVLRVGVKLTVEVNGGSGGISPTINGTDATGGVVVYGKASVSFTKAQVTDVVSWSAVPAEGSFSVINNAATDYTPATAPSVGNIILSANLTGFGSTTVGDFQITGDATGYTFQDPELVIHNGATLIIQNIDTGTSTKHRIKVESGATNVNITLAGVNINVEDQDDICAFLVEADGNANITLTGINTLRSGDDRAGLEIPENASVTILGDGSITATSGSYAAGIGGGKNSNCGMIEISGHVKVEAIGQVGGAGIGGGSVGSGGNIKISGGTVNAIGYYGAGIGGGEYSDGGNVEISGEGTTVIAWGSNYNGSCYDVGGGSNHTLGGSLSVTDGAALEMKNNGTNAFTIYRNCTIIDKNGQSIKYNGEGKAITTLILEVTPQSPQTYPVNVELTATLSGTAGNMSGKMIKFTKGGDSAFSASVPTGDDGKAACTIENLPAGRHIFGASFEGDQENAEASANPVTYQVDLAEQEAITIHGLDNDLIYGDGVIGLTVSGGSVRDGNVSYVSSNPDVASVEDEDQLTIHKAGTFTITATKEGNNNYKEQSATSRLVTVNPATPEISLDFTGGTDINSPVELTVTVSERENGKIPAGTVTFYDGSTIIAERIPLDDSGEAMFSANNPVGGSHTYRAVYSGETEYYNGNSAECSVEVGLAEQTGFGISDPGVKTYGDKDFTLTAIGGQSTGEVSFSAPAGNGILTVKPDGKVSITGAGKVTVMAVKAADGSYHQATAKLEITVNPRDISHVTGTVTGSHVYTGSQLRPAFTVEDGDIAITADDYAGSYGANVNAGSGAGSIILTGQRNYTGAKTVQFDIERRPLVNAVITLESDSYPYMGGEVKPIITSVVVDGIPVPAEAYDVGYTNHTAVGTAAVIITAKADSNFSGIASAAFTITKSKRPSGGGGGSSSGTSTTNPDILHGTWIQTDTGIWMFRQTNGAPAMGRWGLIDGLWYYFDSEGRMLTGWQFLGGQWYYLCTKEDLPAKPGLKEGAMASGWHFDLLLQKWYYLDASGAMAADRVIDGWYVDGSGIWDGKEKL